MLVDSVKLDLARMQARKDEVVTANVKGVEFLFRKNKVDLAEGHRPHRRARHRSMSTAPSYDTKHIVIATG